MTTTRTPGYAGPIGSASAGRAWPTPFRQLREFFAGHPRRQDVLLALVMFAAGGFPATADGKAHVAWPFVVVTAAAICALLVWRRDQPLAVFAGILALCILRWSFREVSRTDISLMISLYSVARYGPARAWPWAAALSVPALLVAVFRLPEVHGQRLPGLFFLGTAAAAGVALGLAVRDRHAQLAALRERAARAEYEREQQARLAALSERARVSREMHDIVGHSLAVIIGLADGGARLAGRRPERGVEALDQIAETGRSALADLRRTLGALHDVDDDVLTPQPGLAELPALLESVRAAGPLVTYHSSGDISALPRGLQLTVYRIVQESLTNSLKHAGPDTSVRVVVDVRENEVQVAVADTGRPDRTPAAVRDTSPGLGLAGIRERATLAGGSATAAPNAAGGWSVHAVLPLEPTP